MGEYPKGEKEMKKTWNSVLALLLAAGLAGCSSAAPASSAAASSAEEPEETTEETTEETAEETTEETTEETADVMSYADYVAADMDAAVTIETFVQGKQSWWQDAATLYCQSEEGALFVYNGAISEEEYDKIIPGQAVRIKGYKGNFEGEIEIVDGEIEVIDGNWTAEPADVTELLGTDELINHQNEFVTFKDLVIEPSQDADGNEVAVTYKGEGDDIYFKASSNGQTYDFTIECYLTGPDTDVYKKAGELNIGDTVDLEGFLYWYQGPNPHITYIYVK